MTITGTGMVTVGDGNGNGTFELNKAQGANSITCPMTINGGTIYNAASSQINAPITFNAANAANTINTSGNLLLTGSLYGGGGFVKTGAATLTLANTESYSGDTNILAGTLQMQANYAIPYGPGGQPHRQRGADHAGLAAVRQRPERLRHGLQHQRGVAHRGQQQRHEHF